MKKHFCFKIIQLNLFMKKNMKKIISFRKIIYFLDCIDINLRKKREK